MKAHYLEVKDLRDLKKFSGVGWDPVKSLVVMSDDAWAKVTAVCNLLHSIVSILLSFLSG